MKLKDFKLGYADAAKELMLEPEIFDKAFWDPNNVLDKLLNSWKYILAGRKGVGKSAFNSKILYDAKENEDIWAKDFMLNDFEYSTFAKASCEGDIVGTKKYFDAWSFLIIFQMYKYMYEEIKIRDVDEINKIVDLLNRMGFSIESSFKKIVTNVSRLKIGSNIGVFDAQYEIEFGHKPISFTERLSSIVEKMKLSLAELYLNKKVYLLIDGVDDILRIKKNQIDVLSSLLRSIDSINTFFSKNEINAKIILFIREDILALVNDPDMNKIKRDALINLSWNNNIDGLKEIVELRLHYDNGSDIKNELWKKIFPSKIKEQPSWEVILTHTLYKPRDILQFLKICQECYPQKNYLSYSETNEAIKVYSRDYFIEEMKNELSGYTADDLINILPAVFQRIGGTAFFFINFKNNVEKQLSSQNVDEIDLKQLLLVLFEAGYVGQLVKGVNRKESVIFKYRNPSATIDYSQRFLIHKGIQKGLGVSL